MNNQFFDIEIGLVPSGVFVPSSQPLGFQVANPYSPNVTIDTSSIASTLADLPKAGSNTRKLAAAELDSYGEAVARIGINLLSSRPDILLVPCRGALKPWRQVSAMCLGELAPLMFVSTGLGSGKNVVSVLDTLRIPLRDVQSEHPHVAVLDTAIGGHGTTALAKVLKQLWREDGRPWNVQFHLLAPKDSSVATGGYDIFGLTEARFACSARVYPVDSLLVEDWDPAFGIRLADADRTTMKPLSSDTYRIVVSQGSSVYVVESQQPYDAINKMIAEAVTQALITTPGLTQAADLTLRG